MLFIIFFTIPLLQLIPAAYVIKSLKEYISASFGSFYDITALYNYFRVVSSLGQ